jgi:A/G-specific adenine glycosylase
MNAAHPDSDLRPLRRRLLSFFDDHARDLPWRRTDDPYAIWVSEVMLQQTRVETVEPYYERFLERFPDVEALADASKDEVLKEWEGLGYYRRARLLHEAAGVVRERHGGRLPDTAEKLRELPGIGPYTAGALASIAFQEASPAVDGNVRRVLSRLFDLADPSPAELREHASRLVDPDRPGDFNQALMELGAGVCTATSPSCPECPVRDLCMARARGTVDHRPAPRKRAPRPEVTYGVAVAVDPDGRLLVRRRPDRGLLAGLWEFPAAEVEDGDGGAAEDSATGVIEALRQHGLDVVPEDLRPLDPVPHTFTHLKATYVPFLVRLDERPPAPPGVAELFHWSTFQELEDLALPVAQQKIRDQARAVLEGH